jgi:hypothetical protein
VLVPCGAWAQRLTEKPNFAANTVSYDQGVARQHLTQTEPKELD